MASNTEAAPVLIHVEHACHPRSAGSAHGADHWVVEQHLDAGRLHRRSGDALCKPGNRFWGLYDERDTGRTQPADCARCIEIAERLGDQLSVAVPTHAPMTTETEERR